MGTHYKFDTVESAQERLEAINSGQPFVIKNRGKSKHIDPTKIDTQKPYCSIIEREGAYYIIADSYTSTHITDRDAVALPAAPEDTDGI